MISFVIDWFVRLVRKRNNILCNFQRINFSLSLAHVEKIISMQKHGLAYFTIVSLRINEMWNLEKIDILVV